MINITYKYVIHNTQHIMGAVKSKPKYCLIEITDLGGFEETLKFEIKPGVDLQSVHNMIMATLRSWSGVSVGCSTNIIYKISSDAFLQREIVSTDDPPNIYKSKIQARLREIEKFVQ